jgi:hypothetical protein
MLFLSFVYTWKFGNMGVGLAPHGQFRMIQFGTEWSSSALHMQIYEDLTYLSTKLKERT